MLGRHIPPGITEQQVQGDAEGERRPQDAEDDARQLVRQAQLGRIEERGEEAGEQVYADQHQQKGHHEGQDLLRRVEANGRCHAAAKVCGHPNTCDQRHKRRQFHDEATRKAPEGRCGQNDEDRPVQPVHNRRSIRSAVKM